jgi:nucleotidyltransferase/DNA polymerase involved in DNA repair
MPSTYRAVIKIIAKGERAKTINYSRRMYAIIRRYTPEVVEGPRNECFAELTGLRTFFKMTYKDLAAQIVHDLHVEIGIDVSLSVATVELFDFYKNSSKRAKTISTYAEMNSLFAGKKYVQKAMRNTSSVGCAKRKVRLIVPFIGKVS